MLILGLAVLAFVVACLAPVVMVGLWTLIDDGPSWACRSCGYRNRFSHTICRDCGEVG